MKLWKILSFLIVSICISHTALLYEDINYPTPNFGAQNSSWDSALGATLEGYKTRYIDDFSTGLVHDPSRTANTVSASVSEGTGYGLLIFLWGNNQLYFDALWAAARDNQQKGNYLFNWLHDRDGIVVSTTSATDAEQDIAMALIFAERLKLRGFPGWENSGIDYGAEAEKIVDAIYQLEISNNYLYPDDKAFETNDFNPSYFSPATYRLFSQFENSSTHNWKGVIDQGYSIMNANPGAANGLAPDWCNFDGSTPSVKARTSGPSGDGSDFWYDAIRVPFRLAMDSLWYQESRAISFLDNAMAWVQVTNSRLSDITGNWYMDNDPVTNNRSWHNEMTIGMWGAGAMGSSNGAKKTQFIQEMSSHNVYGNYFGEWVGAYQYYYNQSLAWLGTGVMNGAAVDVYGDLSIASKVASYNNPSLNVTGISQLQFVVTDNEGWNNISSVTINITDINSRQVEFVYQNDFGNRGFNATTPLIISQSILSYTGDQDTITFNINNLQLRITDNFWAGDITISILCEDYQGNKDLSQTQNVYVNQVPTAQFEVYSNDSLLPTINSIQDLVTFSIVNYADDDQINIFTWDFAGITSRNTSSRANFNYTFPSSITGNTTVTLTVTDYFNAQTKYVQQYWVNPLPVASLNISRLTANIGDPVTFDSSLSSDDISINTIILQYEDGTAPGSTFIETHVYESGGTQNIVLHIGDNYGGSSILRSQIYVNYNPSPDYTRLPLTANIGISINLDAAISWDDDHTTISAYEWFAVELGQTKTGITSNFVYLSPGEHDVILRVTDNWGATGTITKTVYVNYPPTANFSYATENIYIPCTVTFDASIASDFDDSIVYWYWDFGDGSTGNGELVAHSYSIPDTRNVSLVVVDSFGATDSIMIPIKLLSTIRIEDYYYASIQSAIDAAASGNIVSINVSKYTLADYKENLIITKSISIQNESPSQKIILNGQGSRGIMVSGNGLNIDINDMEIKNSSSNYGGAIYINNSMVNLNNMSINTSKADDGGGIYSNTAQLSLVNVTINNCQANNNGGGIYINGGSVVLDSAVVSKNTSELNGGGVYLNNVMGTIIRSKIVNNKSKNGNSGGIEQYKGALSVNFTSFFQNSSELFQGGALSSVQGFLTLKNNLFIANYAYNNGGAIYINDASLYQVNDTVANNDSGSGKGIFVQGDSTANINNSLYYNVDKDMYFNTDINYVSINNSIANNVVGFQPGKVTTSNFVVGVNPLLNANYSLSVYSPFINFGDNSRVSTITADLNGNDRITNNTVDIGAFETFDNVAPMIPQWQNFTNQVTINSELLINAICSTDVFQINFSGGATHNTQHNLYASVFSINTTLNTLSLNTLLLTVQDRAGNMSSISTVLVTHDLLPSPNISVSYITSNYTLTTIFDASTSNAGGSVGTINTYQLFFESGEISSNSTGIFNFRVADMYRQVVTLNVIDNYNLSKSISITINPPSYYISTSLNLMSFPMTFSGNIGQVFSTTDIRIWQYDVLLSPTYNEPALSSSLELGVGYWVRAINGTNLASVTRSYLPNSQQYSISLDAGWNLIGTPYVKNLDFTNVYFKDGATMYSQSNAFSNGLIFNNQVWGYDSSVTPNSYAPYVLTSNIKVWKGYWLYAAKDLEMIITESAIMTKLSNQYLASLQTEDLVVISVESNSYRTKLIAGLANKEQEWFDPRVDMMAPPKYPKQKTSVSFIDHTMELLDLYRPEGNLNWEIQVRIIEDNTTVNINFEAINNSLYEIRDAFNTIIPSNKIQLTKAGTYTYYMRASSHISSAVASNIKIYPNPFNPYSAVSAEKTVTLKYDLASNASIKWQIYNMAGQKVYTADFNASDAEGLKDLSKKILWDGKNYRGQTQSTGLYFYVFVVNGEVAKKGKIILWNE